MPEMKTLQGFTLAVETAADLGVTATGDNPEYERGIVELIARGFLVNNGYDSDEALGYVRREIANMRLRKGL